MLFLILITVKLLSIKLYMHYTCANVLHEKLLKGQSDSFNLKNLQEVWRFIDNNQTTLIKTLVQKCLEIISEWKDHFY